MTRRIRIAFADFWPGFEPEDNWFTRLLRRRFDVEISDDPEFLLYSCFGHRHLAFEGVRIFFSGENVRPDFSTCDYAFTGDHLERPEHLRLPLYALDLDPQRLVTPGVPPDPQLATRSFCNFVYSNPWCRRRNRFFRRLSRYRTVDAGGRHLNNIGGPVADKRAFLGGYKFTIAFENSSYPGYTTEKLVDPMLAGSVPIYWGNPRVDLDFDTGSFLSRHDHGSDDELIERIVALDRDDDAYLAHLRRPWFRDNRPSVWVDPERVLDRFARIFDTAVTPVARSVRHNIVRRARRVGRLVPRATRWTWRRVGALAVQDERTSR